MAFYESTAKGGYYKIETDWLPHIANLFTSYQGAHAPLMLDACAGQGEALHYLSDQWHLKPYANELNTDRYGDCVARFGEQQVLNDDYFKFKLSPNSIGVQLLNPPYDSDSLTGQKQVRLETRFLRHSWRFVAKGGYNIIVVYTHHIDNRLAFDLFHQADIVDVYRMPKKHLERYMQVVIVARKRRSNYPTTAAIQEQAMALQDRALLNYQWLHAERSDEPDYLWTRIDRMDDAPYSIADDISFRGRFYFRPAVISDEMRVKSAEEHGAHLISSLVTDLQPSSESKTIHPLTRPRMRQMSGLIGGGLFNGLRLYTAKGQALVRSSIRRSEVLVEAPAPDRPPDAPEKYVYRILPETHISVLHESGDIDDITGDEALTTFIRDHKDALVDYAKTHFQSQYTFDFIEGLVEPFLDNVRLRKPDRDYEMHTPQKHVVAAAFARLCQHKSVVMAAQMRTGKSSMSSTLMNMLRYGQADAGIRDAVSQPMKANQFNLVMCPPHLVDQWVREIHAVIPDVYAYGIKSGDGTKPIEDVNNFLREIDTLPDHTLKILVCSREMIKLGAGWEAAYNMKKKGFQNPDFDYRLPISASNPKFKMVEYAVDPLTGNRITAPASDKGMPVNRLKKRRLKSGLAQGNNQERGVKKKRFNHIQNPAQGEYARLWQEKVQHYQPDPADSDERRQWKRNMILGARQELRQERTLHDVDNAVGNPLWQESRQDKSPFTLDKGLLLAKRKGTKVTKRMMPIPDGRTILGNPRNPRAGWGGVARYLAQNFKDRIYMIVADELHELKDPHSAQGLAFGRLANAATKVIGLTGTLYGGVASSLFALEFFTNPHVRRTYGWDGIKQWVDKMGVIERVVEYKTQEGNDGSQSERKAYKKPPKEVPGASPELLAELIDHVLFFSLRDLGDAVPELQEEGRGIQTDDELTHNYREWESFATDYNKACLKNGDNSFMGVLFNASRNYLNYPYQDYDVWHTTTIKDPITESTQQIRRKVYVIPGIGDRLTPKEEDLIDYVQSEINAGRGVSIFVNQSGKRPLHNRLEKIIQAHVRGAKPTVLTASVSTSKRETWLDKKMQSGTNILICNPNLVKTGFSLVAFPTCIFYEPPTSLYTVDQAAHRAIAMTQDKECRALYYYYHMDYATETITDADGRKTTRTRYDDEGQDIPRMDTMEARIVRLINDKGQAADFLYGEEGASLHALANAGSSLLDEISKSMAEGSVLDAADLFKKSRAKTSRPKATTPPPAQAPQPRSKINVVSLRQLSLFKDLP